MPQTTSRSAASGGAQVIDLVALGFVSERPRPDAAQLPESYPVESMILDCRDTLRAVHERCHGMIEFDSPEREAEILKTEVENFGTAARRCLAALPRDARYGALFSLQSRAQTLSYCALSWRDSMRSGHTGATWQKAAFIDVYAMFSRELYAIASFVKFDQR